MLLYAAGLASKPMLVTFPFVLLLLDVWPLGRGARGWRALVVEKLPLFALSAASCWVTVLAQGAGGALQSLEKLPLDERVTSAFVAWATYLRRALWQLPRYFIETGLRLPFRRARGPRAVVLWEEVRGWASGLACALRPGGRRARSY